MIGVFICHCGINIGGVVDIDRLVEEVEKTTGDDVLVYRHLFVCSQAGQELITDKIEEENLDRVVIASCSPKHHGGIFSKCVGEKLNPYLWEMVNIREQCSWVHRDDPEKATSKALALIQGGIEKARKLEEIGKTSVPLTKDVLVIGGGIAGMHTSLELADKDFKVYLVEKKPNIGGNMVRLDRTFPTDDCSMCTISPKLNEVVNNQNITLITCAEVEEVSGRPGEYVAKVVKRPRYIDEEKCTGCGTCAEVCPMAILNDFDLNLAVRTAAYAPNSQAVPLKYSLDREKCIQCGLCAIVCEADAIVYDQKEEEMEFTVGAIVLATGYAQYDLSGTEYHYEHPNVVTGLELERLINSTGPTGGELKRPSDGKTPETVVFVQCAGSRDRRHMEYCSKICCMYATKNARLIKQEHPDMDVIVCYIDLRAAGRGYEEYYDAAREMGVTYIKGNVSDVIPDGDELSVRLENTMLDEIQEIKAGLVVLSSALIPSEGTVKMTKSLGLVRKQDEFAAPYHMKIAPVDTANMGMFIAGTCEAPKPIQECIVDASAVASRVSSFLKNDEMDVDLVTAFINPDICIHCGKCEENCVYGAITENEEGTFVVSDISCHACGKCAANCITTAVDYGHYSDIQIEAQINGILSADEDAIIAFCCDQCSYNAADLAGTSKKQYSPRIKIIHLPCSGRVSVNHIMYAFDRGAKGVMVAGCLKDQCHYIDGNYRAEENVEIAKKALSLMGIEAEKCEMYFMSSAMADKFVESVTEMDVKC